MQKYINEKAKITCLVFDFDKTLYSSNNCDDLYLEYIKKVLIDLGDYKKECAEKIMNFFDYESNSRPAFNSICEKVGISVNKWNKYRSKNFYQIDYENAKTLDNKFLKKLKRKYKLFLVSNELNKNVKIKAKKLNINLNIFNKVFAPKTLNTNKQKVKQDIYALISYRYGISFNSMLAIGDRFTVDIKPMLNLGGNGLCIENTKEIYEFFKGDFDE